MPERVPAGCAGVSGVCGAQQSMPFVQPGGTCKESCQVERSGKTGQFRRAGVNPAHHGAQRIGRRPVQARRAPAQGLRAYEEAAVRRMRNTRAKTKSISADSGVGNKGVKAGPRRTVTAARSILPGRRPAAAGQADCSHKRQARRDDRAPSGGP